MLSLISPLVRINQDRVSYRYKGIFEDILIDSFHRSFFDIFEERHNSMKDFLPATVTRGKVEGQILIFAVFS